MVRNKNISLLSNLKIACGRLVIGSLLGTLILSYTHAWAVEPATAVGPVAEIVWFESRDQRNGIYYSAFSNNEGWSESALPIYESENAIATPVIATAKDGKKYLIWSEQQGTHKMQLMWMTGAVVGEDETALQWSTPRVFSALGESNLGASMVIDAAHQVWVFWSANKVKYSDVYMSRQTPTGWSEPQIIHAKNDTPDIDISAALTDQGDIVVTWFSLDRDTFNYIEKQRIYPRQPVRSNDKAAKPSLADRWTRSDIANPDFVPNNQRVLVHFPDNSIMQTTAVR